jgi:hypothetical protein
MAIGPAERDRAGLVLTDKQIELGQNEIEIVLGDVRQSVYDIHDLRRRHSAGNGVGWDLEHVRKASIERDQPAVGVEHAQTLRHVVQRRVEPHVVIILQLPLRGFQRIEGPIQYVEREDADREVDRGSQKQTEAGHISGIIERSTQAGLDRCGRPWSP